MIRTWWLTLSLAVACGIGGHAAADPGDALDTGGGGISKRYVVHASVALENGHFSEAMDYSNRALALYPAFARARFTRGRTELASGDYAASLDDFTQVIAAHPEFPTAFYYRGLAHLRARQAAAAVEDFNHALQASTGMGSLMAANIFATRSLAFEMLGQANASIADLTAALKSVTSYEHDWAMLNNRCYSAAVAGLLETAQDSCDESISRHTRDMSVYDSRGFVELKRGLWEKAVADYTQSLYYRPELSTSLYGRALARHARGDSAGAAADMKAAAESEPKITMIMARLGVAAPAQK
jgi:tetratricopeptide (TPR) repeat protein